MTITPAKTLAVRQIKISPNRYAPAVQIPVGLGHICEVVISNTAGTYVVIQESAAGYWADPTETNPLASPNPVWPPAGSLVYDWEHRSSTMFLLGTVA